MILCLLLLLVCCVASTTLCCALLHLALLRMRLVCVRLMLRAVRCVGVVMRHVLRLLALDTSRWSLVLAVIATHIGNLLHIDFDITLGHKTNISHNRLIVWMFVVELIALGAHKACYVDHLAINSVVVLHIYKAAHKTLSVLAIVSEHHTALGIWQLFRLNLQVLA